MSRFLAVFFIFFFRILLFSEKVLIFTSAYNRPDFIEIQCNTFKKFLRDEYVFVVFNDARDQILKRQIERTCSQLGVQCINIPQEIHDQPYLERWPGEGFHDPAVRNANVVQYALNALGYDHPGIVVILDSDMFLVQPFSIKEFIDGYDIAGIPQGNLSNGLKISYLWIGIAFLNMENLPEKRMINFNCGKINGVNVDAGGYTYHYLFKHPELKVKYLSNCLSSSLSCAECRSITEHYQCQHNLETLQKYGLDDAQIDALHSGLENVEFVINGAFFHYRSGTNWDRQTKRYHENKTLLFDEYIQRILSSP